MSEFVFLDQSDAEVSINGPAEISRRRPDRITLEVPLGAMRKR